MGLRHAPEFEDWLQRMGLLGADGRLQRPGPQQALLAHSRTLGR